MSTKKLSAGIAIALLTASLTLPAHAQRDESSPWGWLAFLWQGWFGAQEAVPEAQPLERQFAPAGVAADELGRTLILPPGTTAPGTTDHTDAGVAADGEG